MANGKPHDVDGKKTEAASAQLISMQYQFLILLPAQELLHKLLQFRVTNFYVILLIQIKLKYSEG